MSKKFTDVFGKWLINDLKIIKQWIQSEKAIDKVSQIKVAEDFLTKLKVWTKDFRNIVWKSDIETKLKPLLWKSDEAKLFDKLMIKEWNDFLVSLESITEKQILALSRLAKEKWSKELTDVVKRLDIIKQFNWSVWSYAWGIWFLTKGKDIWDVAWNLAKLSLITDTSVLTNMFIAYNKFSWWVQKTLSSIKNKDLAEFLEKLFIYTTSKEFFQ